MRPRWLALLVVPLTACQDYNYMLMDVTDTFNQNPPESVDILLIVDNSGSMEPYQDELSTHFSEFLTYFVEADIDYQIAAVTTDADAKTAGQLVKTTIISPDTADSDEKFNQIVRVGTNGSGSEMGLETSYLALTPPLNSSTNAGFLREEASLSIIYVSDEEDSSPRPVNDYINDFFEIKGQRERDVFNASALVVVDVSTCPIEAQGNSVINTRYVDVANQTNGVVGDICSSDFGSIVTDLSLNASRMLDTFYLSTEPAVATLQVWVDEEAKPCDGGEWTFQRVTPADSTQDKPAIVFEPEFIPKSNSRIVVRYDLGGGDPADFCTGTGADSAAE